MEGRTLSKTNSSTENLEREPQTNYVKYKSLIGKIYVYMFMLTDLYI